MHQLSENMLRVTYSFWFMGYVYIIGSRFPLSILRWFLMVQVLQRGRLNQVAVHNLDMHMCFQLKFWSWYNAIMKTTFHVMEIM